MLQEARRREAEVSALLEGSRAVLEHREFQDAARAIFDSCKGLVGATSGYVALLSKEGTENEVLFLDSGGLPCTVDPSLPMPIRGLREKAYRTGKAVYHNDFSEAPWAGFLPEGHVRLENVLFAPLMVGRKAVGLLGVANKPGGFSQRDARMASAFGELAAIALQNSRALESLETSEERLRSVTQSANDGIISTDSSGAIVYWNETAGRMFGYSADEIIGKPLTVIIPKRLRNAHREGLDRVLATGESRIIGKTVEVLGLRRDGSEIPVELSLAAWSTKEGTFFTGILRDITRRKQAEEALREARDELELRVKERTADLVAANRQLQREIAERKRAEGELREAHQLLQTIFDHTHLMVAFLDPQFNFIRVNRAYAQADNREPPFFPGKNHFDLYPNAENQAIFRRVVETGEPHFAFAKPFEYAEHPERGVTYWDWSLVPIGDLRGRPVGLVFTLLNVTERIRLERELLEIGTQEQQRIGQELHDELGQELTGLGYLARSLQQRLRNQGLPETETADELARGIQHALGQVHTIVQGLVPLEIGADALVPALQALTATVEERAGVRCRIESGQPVQVNDNTAIQLYRIAQEAVNNALKHGQPEHITVELKADVSRITLKVHDDGVGIRRDADQALGSGLRIMRYRADMIGGTLEVQALESGGTMVACTLQQEHHR